VDELERVLQRKGRQLASRVLGKPERSALRVASSECLTAAPKRQIVAPDATGRQRLASREVTVRKYPFVAVAVVALTSAGAAQPASSQSTDTGTLALQADVAVSYPPITCPAGTLGAVECFTRAGRANVPGLGLVEESSAYFVEDDPPGCAAGQVRVLPTTVRLVVKDKGEIQIRVGGTGCLDRIPPNPLRAEEAFTVTSGLGKYAGASGGGQLSTISYGPPNFGGKDTWTGTLTVPGLSFDLTPPTLTAPASKTIRVARRVKRIRVSYAVAAHDDVDGTVPVSCTPRSGSWFPLGRTRVLCVAVDTSGNLSNAKFVVTVKRKA
jgi:hypothetical protein